MRPDISKPTPFIYLALEIARDAFIYLLFKITTYKNTCMVHRIASMKVYVHVYRQIPPPPPPRPLAPPSLPRLTIRYEKGFNGMSPKYTKESNKIRIHTEKITSLPAARCAQNFIFNGIGKLYFFYNIFLSCANGSVIFIISTLW